MFSAASNPESDAGARGRRQHLARHLAHRFLCEVEAAAMHGDHDVRIELRDLADNLREIISRCGPKMETAHDGMNLLHARYLHRLPDRIHDADMTAGGNDDKALVLQVEAGRMLVNVLVGYDLAFHLGRQVMARIAPGAVLLLEFDERVRQHLLDAVALDLACGEGVTANHDRRLAQHELDVPLGDVAAVEHSGVREVAHGAHPDIALAEIVLAAGVDCQLGRHVLAVTIEETEQPAQMVEMTVAHDEGIDLRRI